MDKGLLSDTEERSAVDARAHRRAFAMVRRTGETGGSPGAAKEPASRPREVLSGASKPAATRVKQALTLWAEPYGWRQRMQRRSNAIAQTLSVPWYLRRDACRNGDGRGAARHRRIRLKYPQPLGRAYSSPTASRAVLPFSALPRRSAGFARFLPGSTMYDRRARCHGGHPSLSPLPDRRSAGSRPRCAFRPSRAASGPGI